MYSLVEVTSAVSLQVFSALHRQLNIVVIRPRVLEKLITQRYCASVSLSISLVPVLPARKVAKIFKVGGNTSCGTYNRHL